MNKRHIGFLCTGIAVIILLVLVASVFIQGNKGDIQKGSLNLTSGTQQELNDRANETGFIVIANTNVTVRNNEANFMLENPEENKNKCQVDIYDDNDRLIYQSDIIPPGYYIEYAKLFEEIDAGEHLGKAIFNILNDNNETKSTATVNLKITAY